MASLFSFVPTTSFNRSFGGLLSLAGAALAGYTYWKQGPAMWVVAGVVIALVAGALAIVAPAVLSPLSRLWMALGLLIGKVVNPIVFGLMFFGLITPIGWIARLRGRDALRLRANAQAVSHWVDRLPPGPDAQSFKNQY